MAASMSSTWWIESTGPKDAMERNLEWFDRWIMSAKPATSSDLAVKK
jgi:hypothetical protein